MTIQQNELFLNQQQPHVSGSKRRILLPAGITATCHFSECGRYRTKLKHVWDSSLPIGMLAMMNPSDAGTIYTDATVSKGRRIFKRLGYGALLVGNACAVVSTQPSGMREIEDPVGPDNHKHLREMAIEADLIVVAHGNMREFHCHAEKMVEVLLSTGKDLHVFGFSSKGIPLHLLSRGNFMVRESVVPVLWKKAK